MKNIINIALLLTILTIVGCVNDSTVHDLTELNDVTIKGISDDGYEALLGEEFVLDPDISTLHNDESNMEYLWYYYQRFSPFKSDTISREKVLKYTFDNMTIGGNYNITLKVRDKVSNVFYQKTVPFTAINKYSRGTMLLCKDNNETELNFFIQKKNLFFENVYAKENSGEKLDANPNKVFSISPYDRNIAAFKAIVVLNNSQNGGHYINPTSFKKIETIRGKLGGILPANLEVKHYCTNQQDDYLISNGKLHFRVGEDGVPEANWGVPLTINSETPDYNLAPLSLHPEHVLPLLYDNLNNRFLLSNSDGVFNFFTGADHTMTAFDANDLGDGMEMLCGGYFSDNDKMWALMKNTVDGKFWILRFEMDEGKFIAQAKVEVTSLMAPNLSAATKFESLSDIFNTNQSPWVIRVDGTPGRMMYLANNNVYVLNMNVDAGNVAENKLIDGGEKNVNITNVLAHPIMTPTADDPNKQYTRIDMCVKDLSLTGKQGGVIFYKINQLGGLSVEEINRKTGFCDEVIDVDEKLN